MKASIKKRQAKKPVAKAGFQPNNATIASHNRTSVFCSCSKESCSSFATAASTNASLSAGESVMVKSGINGMSLDGFSMRKPAALTSLETTTTIDALSRKRRKTAGGFSAAERRVRQVDGGRHLQGKHPTGSAVPTGTKTRPSSMGKTAIGPRLTAQSSIWSAVGSYKPILISPSVLSNKFKKKKADRPTATCCFWFISTCIRNRKPSCSGRRVDTSFRSTEKKPSGYTLS